MSELAIKMFGANMAVFAMLAAYYMLPSIMQFARLVALRDPLIRRLDQAHSMRERVANIDEGRARDLLHLRAHFLTARAEEIAEFQYYTAINRVISRRIPFLWRLSPHSATVAVIVLSYAITATIASAVFVNFQSSDIGRLIREWSVYLSFVISIAPLPLSTAVTMAIGNEFEMKLAKGYYKHKHFSKKVDAIREIRHEIEIEFPLVVRNGPGFDIYSMESLGGQVVCRFESECKPPAVFNRLW